MHFSPRNPNFRVIGIIFLGPVEFGLRGVYSVHAHLFRCQRTQHVSRGNHLILEYHRIQSRLTFDFKDETSQTKYIQLSSSKQRNSKKNDFYTNNVRF